MTGVYLDSCIVIYLVQGPEPIRRSVGRFLVEDSSSHFHVSDLTRLECRVWPLREKAWDLLAEFDRFFASHDLHHAPLDAEVFDLATELRAEVGLKTPDSLHVAAAIRAGCEEIWTNDHRFPKALDERILTRIMPGKGS